MGYLFIARPKRRWASSKKEQTRQRTRKTRAINSEVCTPNRVQCSTSWLHLRGVTVPLELLATHRKRGFHEHHVCTFLPIDEEYIKRAVIRHPGSRLHKAMYILHACIQAPTAVHPGIHRHTAPALNKRAWCALNTAPYTPLSESPPLRTDIAHLYLPHHMTGVPTPWTACRRAQLMTAPPPSPPR